MKSVITKFDGEISEFELWKSRVTLAMTADKCWAACDNDFVIATTIMSGSAADTVKNTEADQKARLIIASTLTDKVFRLIHKKALAKEQWKYLCDTYEKKDVMGIVFLKNRFSNCKQGKNETVEAYINRKTIIREELTVAGQTISDPEMAMELMRGISDVYEQFCSAATASQEPDKIDLEQLKTKLRQEEYRRLERIKEKGDGENEYGSDQAFYSNQKTSKFICFNCNKEGHGSRDCPLEKQYCTKCKGHGHIAQHCNPSLKKSKSSQKKNKKHRANVASQEKETKDKNSEKNSKEKDKIFFSGIQKGSNKPSKNIWLIDSGASAHICCNKEMFREIKPFKSEPVTVANGNPCEVKGIGDVPLETIVDGKTVKILMSNTLYVPDFSINLISVGMLLERGIFTVFDKSGTGCTIKDDNDEIFARGTKCSENSRLFEIKMTSSKSNKQMALAAHEVISKWKLWHCRLGHLSIQNMKRIRAEDTEFSKTREISEFCECCALGKAKKLPHKSTDKTNKDKNRVVIHSDLKGPSIESLGSKSKYFVTYLCNIDEYSQTYLLEKKSEQEEKFKEFKAVYELQNERKIKELRTDNGGEYLSNNFKNYLKENGIKHNTSVSYCSQSNGKSERLNLTLIEKARCMLIQANLENNMWGAAILTANYLRNISPSEPLNGKSPFEVRFNRLPNIQHLRVFGCKAYPLKLNNKESSYAPVAKENCILIGYGDKEGIYWILDRSKNKAFRSRDVRFDEKPIVFSQNVEIISKDVETEVEDEDMEVEYPSDSSSTNLPLANEERVDEDNQHDDFDNDDFDFKSDYILNRQERSKSNKKKNSKSSSTSVRKSSRETKKPERFQAGFSAYTEEQDELEPNSIDEALKSKEKDEWKEAIQSEFDSLKENDTWSIAELPSGKKTIKTRWIFKVKRNAQNEPERYKARLVAKGFEQKYGIDYNETFAPVIKKQALMLFLSIAVAERLEVHHIDISTAFLYGELNEDVYIEPPDGYNQKLNKNQVLKLK